MHRDRTTGGGKGLFCLRPRRKGVYDAPSHRSARRQLKQFFELLDADASLVQDLPQGAGADSPVIRHHNA